MYNADLGAQFSRFDVAEKRHVELAKQEERARGKHKKLLNIAQPVVAASESMVFKWSFLRYIQQFNKSPQARGLLLKKIPLYGFEIVK